jgi:hypothetical protein
VVFIDRVLWGVNIVLGKGCVCVCVGGGGLDKQYKAIKAIPTISSILHTGPYGIYHIRKPVNKEFPVIILNNNNILDTLHRFGVFFQTFYKLDLLLPLAVRCSTYLGKL